MFRNYYEEQSTEDVRDSWYKPNLLYNIHYRPPTPVTPPKMKVVTKKFNPSICTCGEHDCVPRYRMEKEVVWLNKEPEKERKVKVNVRQDVCDDGGEDKQLEKEEKEELEVRNPDNVGNVKDGGDDGSKDKEREKEEKVELDVRKPDDVGNAKDGDEDVGKDKELENVKVYVRNPDDVGNVQDEDEDAGKDKELEKEEKVELDVRNPDDVVNVKNEVDYVEKLCELELPEADVEVPFNDCENFGSSFGIMRVYVDSGLHTTWAMRKEIHAY